MTFPVYNKCLRGKGRYRLTIGDAEKLYFTDSADGGTMTTTVDIDTGGTFTDATVRRGNKLHELKTETTPNDFSVCFENVVEQAAAMFDETLQEFLTTVDCIRYSTTIGTNAIIERNGGQVGVLAPGESISTLESRNEELVQDIVSAGARRSLRSDADSAVVTRRYNEVADELVDNVVVGMDSLDTERSVREPLLEEQPQHLLGSVPIHLSHDVTDDPDTGRRVVTAVLDAYLHSRLGGFLYKIEDFLRDNGYEQPLLVFCNDGNSTRVARTTAIRTYNSGPAAGIEGAARLAALYDVEHAITVDIGGTSADSALLPTGSIRRDEFGSIDGVEVSFPIRDVSSVSGGGGTIATVEDGGLSLGPESAGANPGPACYGLGGSDPTVTDADVVTGILSPGIFAGEELSLDADRAERAIRDEVAEQLGVTVDAAACQIRDEIQQQIGRTLRATLEAEAIDPTETTLFAYGGAGPTHAPGVAVNAGIQRVVIPSRPAVFSAYSVGFSTVAHQYRVRVGSRADMGDIEAAVARRRRRAEQDIRGEGFAPEEATYRWRLRGVDGADGTEIGSIDPDNIEAEIGNHVGSYDQVVLELEVQASLPTHEFDAHQDEAASPHPVANEVVRWPAPDTDGGVEQETPVFDRREIAGTVSASGPAIIRDTSTTYAIPPSCEYRINEYGHTVITPKED